jgi:tetratricopeptide (TPR) repeat protein
MCSCCKVALPLLVLLAAAPLPAAGPAKPTAKQIATWVEQLGDNDFATRQKASRLLWEAGEPAEAPLKQAARSDDLEVRRRANEILEKFRWGLYPDTPRDVVTLIERYQAGNADVKSAAVRELFDKGGAGCAAVAKILTAEPFPELRRNLLLVIAQDAPRAFASLMAENDFGTLERLLEASLAVPLNESAAQNYAAYWLLRGRLDARIGPLRAKAERDNDPAAQAVLVYLYRAKGDLAAARTAAEKAGRQDLLEQVLIDQGDWAALAKLADDRRQPAEDLRGLAFRLAYHRLAGDAAGVDKAAADLRAQLGSRSEDAVLWLAAKALLLNGRPRDALPLLERSQRPATTYEILTARTRIPEALALAGRAVTGDANGRAALDIVHARTLYLLGERDKAREAFARVADDISRGKGGKALDLLIRTEARIGLKEDALDYVARLLARPGGESREETLLGPLFPRHRERAVAWWQFLRQRSPAQDPVAALKQVRDLAEGRTRGKELEALAGEAARAAQRQAGREHWLLGVGDTCQAAGLDAAARDCLEKAAEGGTPAALVHLGDFLADRKLWAQAANRYGQAWQKDRRNPLPLYLQGWALARGGDDREGARLTDLAHWIPLGEEAVRHRFAADLKQRGQDEAARREWQLLFAISQPLSFFAGEGLRDASLDAIAHKDYLKAADFQERALFRVLEPDTEFVEKSAYLAVPAYVHRLRALGQAAAGRGDEARKEAEAALDLLPGNVELTVQFVPALDRLGRKKEADALFDAQVAVLRPLCADYPRGAWLHNNLAWMSACCRRNLDEGLEHARKAVELDPETTGYLDTLAEVHFQRGEREQALEFMKKCLARDAGNAYYRKQLKRFEAGDRNADLPKAADD